MTSIATRDGYDINALANRAALFNANAQMPGTGIDTGDVNVYNFLIREIERLARHVARLEQHVE